jgi:hypothetical protein
MLQEKLSLISRPILLAANDSIDFRPLIFTTPGPHQHTWRSGTRITVDYVSGGNVHLMGLKKKKIKKR